MKRKFTGFLLRLTLALAAAVMLTAVCFAGEAVNARRSNTQIFINDRSAAMSGYVIGGNTYYNILDLAYALRDTSSCFDVVRNGNRVEVFTQRPYSGQKSAGQIPWWEQSVKAVRADAQLIVDGRVVEVTAYNVDGGSCYDLRDLGNMLSFSVHQMGENICVYTLDEHTRLAGGTARSTRKMSAAVSTARWGHVFQSYLYQNGDVFYAVEGESSGGENMLVVDAYDKWTFTLLGSRRISIELDTFGGFFAGKEYNYAVFGQDNSEEDDRKEVIRVVKYSKSFERLGSVSITGGECYAAVPFEAGSLRMAENGSELVVHTSRRCYAGADRVSQQSQLTIRLDTGSMRVKNALGPHQENYVGHSFNQFVLFDDGKLVLLDHGDAYPRSIVMSRLNGNSYSRVELLKIPGAAGANCTGVGVGGFEASGSNYLAAVNSVDHSKVTAYGSFSMTGLVREERDVALLVCSKDGAKVQTVRLTDYIGKGKLGSTPYLVKLSNDRFLVLWEEFAYGRSFGTTSQGVRYVEVDGAGKVLTEVRALQNARLSSDCQPVLLDGAVTWYVNMKAGRMFYQIAV